MFHDENFNSELDTNMIGFPKKPGEFPNSGSMLFGQASF
ncbi:MAG: DUF2141 domain-containing protein [Candidatus Marinimicrobia bacterium]|nr:DUF2141 domain-containing protein [Candidatus Neomarinimicrobiota bacterium]MBT3634492.1 DUF2141 domain-containing protein [Candidatus Neomarinimicrobiota bacterium]MBT3683389.1 DUF2141 domain-containing protein [Candidatus Neomarinimicrobiota bacterium]MBT3760277.1 DUF2141 domain-containing protein [Candidatus Neomarinimicrobiota bacterium]MBT3896372.1 DUF2141 domain-containing protein [Candidatus Neomarinimicrobiota bacterium]